MVGAGPAGVKVADAPSTLRKAVQMRRNLGALLRECLRLLRRGEPILHTDRGDTVAKTRRPVASPRTPWANRPDAYPALRRIAPDGTARALIDEDRGER